MPADLREEGPGGLFMAKIMCCKLLVPLQLGVWRAWLLSPSH